MRRTMVFLIATFVLLWSVPVAAECPEGKDCTEVYLNAEGAFAAGDYNAAISKALAADDSMKGRATGYEKLEPSSAEADNYLFAAAATIRLEGKVDLTSGKPSSKDAGKNMAWAIAVLRFLHEAEPEAFRPAAYLAEGLAQSKKTSAEARTLLAKLAESEAPLDAQTWVVLAKLHGDAGAKEKEKEALRSCLAVASTAEICGVTVEEISGISIESGTGKDKKSTGAGIEIEAGSSSGAGEGGKAAIEVF